MKTPTARLRTQNAELRRRIRLARSVIPPPLKERNELEEDEDFWWYARVSERTISEVEALLDLRKPLPKGRR